MRLKTRYLGLAAGRPVATLDKKTAEILSVYVSERVRIRNKHSIVAVVDIAEQIIKRDEVALSAEAMEILNVKEGSYVEVTAESPPITTEYILEKLDGKELDVNKINTLAGDIMHNALTEAELAFFVSGVYIHGMSDEEIANMVKAMVRLGTRLDLKGEIYDKHCIGGIAGNRTTPIIISICASLGLKIPKTSSRAITSAAGTADVIETIAKVDFSVNEIKKIINKTGACMVWGGSLGLAPIDDKIIQIERHLSIDPKSQLIASILAKKMSIGSKGILIDIPYGNSAKIRTKKEAKKLGNRFKKVADMLNLKLEFEITDGSQPIGNGIGPVLEIRDILKVLMQEDNRPIDLEKRAVLLAGKILEMSGKVKKGIGAKTAMEILRSGKAYNKFKEIIEAQGGTLRDVNKKLRTAEFALDIISSKHGKVREIDNRKIALIARNAGCPADKSSGVYLYKHVNDKIDKGEKIITIYSGSLSELNSAKKTYEDINPILIS